MKTILNLALTVLALGACSSSSSGAKTLAGPDMAALGSVKDASGGVVERFDLNGDGTADLWKRFKIIKTNGAEGRKIMYRKEMDLNFDGKVDVRIHLDENGKMYKEDMDLDFDGHIDAVAHYKDEFLIKRELDLSFDSQADVVKYYEKGKLIRKERDSNKDGRMDVWEYYETDRLVRVGRDKDGDGKPEIFDDAPEPEPEIPGGAPDSSPGSSSE
jgi:hypothetical protein